MKIMKIDFIELKFKDEKGHIKSLDEFSEMFEMGFYLVEHPEWTVRTRVIMDIDSDCENRIFSFDFNRKDIEWGHYWVDKLIQKWTIIWEWYYQSHIDSNQKFTLGSTTIEDAKMRFGENSEEHNSIRSLSNVALEEEVGTSESELNRDNMEWVLDFDEKNSIERMREEKMYFDHDLKIWIDLEHSLPAIRKIIRKVDTFERPSSED